MRVEWKQQQSDSFLVSYSHSLESCSKRKKKRSSENEPVVAVADSASDVAAEMNYMRSLSEEEVEAEAEEDEWMLRDRGTFASMTAVASCQDVESDGSRTSWALMLARSKCKSRP